MKKILIVVMCTLVVLSSLIFASCDVSRDNENDTSTEDQTNAETVEGGGVEINDINGNNAYDTYVALMEDCENWDNFEMAIMQKSSSRYGSSNIVSTTNICLRLDGQKVYMKIESPDTPYINGETWFIDGYVYQAVGEDKYKEEMSFEDFMLGEGSMYMPEDFELTSKEFEKAIIVKYEDGSFGIRIDATEYYSEQMQDEMLDIGEISECKIELLVEADGSYKGMELTTNMTMDMDGMTVSVLSEMSYEFSNIGTTVVTGPENPDEFEEFDWSIDDEIPDMTDWTDEEIESWWDAYLNYEVDDEIPDMTDWTDEEIESWWDAYINSEE